MFPFLMYAGRSEHQCNPIPKEGVRYSYARFHSEHRAGYEIVEYKWKISECPVCNEIHCYDKEATGIREFEAYV